MKKKVFLCFFLILGVYFFFSTSCKKSVVEPPGNTNLLPNGSFEIDHTPTLKGWYFGNPQLAELVNEAPPGGGNWSLKLTSDWAPTTGYVYTPVKNVSSGDVVKLSAFIKATGPVGGGGMIGLMVAPEFNTVKGKRVSSTDTLWTRVSLIDTLTLAQGDTLWVVLSSLNTEIIPFQGLFDIVELKKISK